MISSHQYWCAEIDWDYSSCGMKAKKKEIRSRMKERCKTISMTQEQQWNCAHEIDKRNEVPSLIEEQWNVQQNFYTQEMKSRCQSRLATCDVRECRSIDINVNNLGWKKIFVPRLLRSNFTWSLTFFLLLISFSILSFYLSCSMNLVLMHSYFLAPISNRFSKNY